MRYLFRAVWSVPSDMQGGQIISMQFHEEVRDDTQKGNMA